MSNDIAVIVGKNLRKHRTARRMTREQLAEAINLDTGYLGMCERGERQLGLNKTIEVIDYFGITPNDILPTNEKAETRLHEKYIEEINELLKDFSDNQLTAAISIIMSLQTLK